MKLLWVESNVTLLAWPLFPFTGTVEINAAPFAKASLPQNAADVVFARIAFDQEIVELLVPSIWAFPDVGQHIVSAGRKPLFNFFLNIGDVIQRKACAD
jgi:hypothetical protein